MSKVVKNRHVNLNDIGLWAVYISTRITSRSGASRLIFNDLFDVKPTSFNKGNGIAGCDIQYRRAH